MTAMQKTMGEALSKRSVGIQEPEASSVEFSMASKQHLSRFIDARSEVRRPPLVGMQFLHEPAMRAPDFLGARPRLKAKDLISLLFGHFAGSRRAAAPRCHTFINVLTPSGLPAVKIRGQ